MVKEPVIHFYDGAPTEGFTQDLAEMFAKKLALPLRIQQAKDYEELEQWALKGEVHIAAYLNTDTQNTDLMHSTPIGIRPLWVVQLGDAAGPKILQDLHGLEIHTPVGSAAGVALKKLAPQVVPRMVELRDRDEMDIFEDMAQGRSAYAAVDELYMQYAANAYPDLQPLVQIPGNRVFAWAVPATHSNALAKELNAFINAVHKDGRLAALRDRYFGYIKRLDAQGAQAFISDVTTKLPRYKKHFHKAQELTGIDWRQLAALAYQESKWDPQATSPTGVRGMMMLTEATAKHAGIQDRLDAEQSIMGGSRYLLQLMQGLPESAKQPDRLWLGLAAYNVGPGHVQSGRRLASKLKKDPDSWFDMKKVLPRLTRCRGGEAVILVENVRSFYGILAHMEPSHVPAKASKPLKNAKQATKAAHAKRVKNTNNPSHTRVTLPIQPK
jgi:membrane-bound lytic murein transglycosylase F